MWLYGLAAQGRMRNSIVLRPLTHERAYQLFWPFGDVYWGGWVSGDVVPVGISLHDKDSAGRRGKEAGGPPTKLLPSRRQLSPCLASVKTEAKTNVPYDPELTVTSPVHRKPDVCSLVVTISPLYTLHEWSAGKQPQTHHVCMSHSLQPSEDSAAFLHPEELIFHLFLKLLGRHRIHMQTCGLFLDPGVWIFTGCWLTMLTLANQQ